ncbi:hypothetical protein [uncultured Thiocystis sp.]|jgi:hypothetical protein|uniref:hypothetical protein n=1 Tax=uncultured Thiocystis sp. TaxID=1202134 RepID=UPI0025CFDFCB|nr:hypothetical protein [uncultured Thiocystis sp.]
MQLSVLLRRAQPGTKSGVQGHLKRAIRMQTLIAERFGIREPYQFKAKHLRWVLEHGTAELAPSSRYDYWRTARALAAILGHWPDWEPHLRGSWISPRPDLPRDTQPTTPSRGGRPPKLARVRRERGR